MNSFILFISLTFIYLTYAQNSGISMYEVSTRPWIYYLSQKYGKPMTKLMDIPDQELQSIADQNFDIIWMMGVWHLGEYGLHYDQTNPQLLTQYSKVLPGWTQADVIGSPYAVTEYTCNPELGTDSDIAAFRQKLNSMGLKLMLDFVPNHSAVDAPWPSSNPDYYIRAPKGTTGPSGQYYNGTFAYGSACGAYSYCGEGWQDTLQLNYWNLELRKARINQILKVASLCDAIRNDMAYLEINKLFGDNWGPELSSWGYSEPKTEFWVDAIKAVKQKYPNIIMLAEVYSPWQQDLQNMGFDYTYDKQLYDKLGNGNENDIRGWISGNSLSFISHSAHFTSNHDQQRAAAYFGSWWRADAAALITYTLPGMRFFWWGVQYGWTARLMVQLRRETSQPIISDVALFYKNFINITNNDVFNKGTWTYISEITGSSTSNLLIAYRWQYQNQKRLCVFNYSAQSGSGLIKIPNAEPINGNDTIPVTDLLSHTTYYRSVNDMKTKGLFVVVNSWYGQIFEYN